MKHVFSLPTSLAAQRLRSISWLTPGQEMEEKLSLSFSLHGV